MDIVTKKHQLSAIACDEVSELVADFCSDVGAGRKDTVHCRLGVENCLSYWLTNGLEGHTLTTRMGKNLRTPYVLLDVDGPQINPKAEEEEEFGIYLASVQVRLGLEPDYSYARGHNRVLFSLRKEPLNQLVTLGLVLVASVVLGLCGMLLPEYIREGILSGVIQPLYNTFFSLLTCLAGPMIFLSVAWGIYGIGDVETLGRIGKRLMLRFLCIVLMATCCATPLFFLLGPGLSEASDFSGQLSSIMELVLGIIPPNIVEPFASGNTLQIIFLSVAVALGLLYLGQRTSAVAIGIEQVNALVGFLMETVSKLVPFVIFLVVINMIWSGTIHTLSGMWRLLVVHAGAMVVTGAVFLLVTSWRQKVSPWLLARKCLPTFMIALTTASSAAAFNTNIETCEKKFGIDNSLTSFGLPLAMVVHRPMFAIYCLFAAFYFAGEYDVSCSPMWLVMAVLVCCVLAIAAPPIPGGGAVVYTMLFTQLGIPSGAVALALTVDLVVDFYTTAFEQLALLMSLINASADLQMLDTDILRA